MSTTATDLAAAISHMTWKLDGWELQAEDMVVRANRIANFISEHDGIASAREHSRKLARQRSRVGELEFVTQLLDVQSKAAVPSSENEKEHASNVNNAAAEVFHSALAQKIKGLFRIADVSDGVSTFESACRDQRLDHTELSFRLDRKQVWDLLKASGNLHRFDRDKNGIEEIYAAADADGEGKITLDELLKACIPGFRFERPDGSVLLSAGTCSSAASRNVSLPALWIAARDGRVEAVGRAVRDNRGKTDIPLGPKGTTSLYVASQNGHLGTVAALLRLRADPAVARAADGYTPLFAAAAQGHADVASVLIAAGALVDTKTTDDGSEPLLAAAFGGHLAVAAVLIEAGAKVDSPRTADGSVPLLLAATEGHFETVTLLLAAGAQWDRERPGDGATALSVSQGNPAVTAALNRAKAETLCRAAGISMRTDVDGKTPLYVAAEKGKTGSVKALVAAGFNVDQSRTGADWAGMTPLSVAAAKGKLAAVVTLLKAGANAEIALNSDGRTPLYFAAGAGHADIVAALLQAGASPNTATSDMGGTALMIASQNGHETVVDMLIQARAKVDVARTDTGSTPIHTAAQRGHAAVVESLRFAGADTKRPTHAGETPLAAAEARGHTDVISILRD